MDSGRHALVVGNAFYDHDDLADLDAVRADLHYMEQVLLRRDIGMFASCTVVAEATNAELTRAIETFSGERRVGETALVYFSGHGQYSLEEEELFFIARDSDPADLSRTAVPAGFLNRQIQDCRATAKVLLLDCCDSGSIFPAFSTKGPVAQPRLRMPRPSGVHVITASDALQPASAKAPADSALGTSWFTGEIVEGLRTGRVKAGPDPWITTHDLFTFLVKQMRRADRLASQRPTMSTLRATDNLVIARSTAQTVELPQPTFGRAAQRRVPENALRLVRGDREGGPRWAQLIDYYRSCLAAESAASTMPERVRAANYRLVDSGPETLQSGTGASIAAPSEWDDGKLAGSELWYGYPVVTLVDHGGGPGSGAAPVRPKIAPLVMQQVEIERDEHGNVVLTPTGGVMPHSRVVEALLDRDDAQALLSAWQPSWQHGNASQMLQAIRELLRDLHLPELEPLDPSVLRGDSARSELRSGAHNTAVLLCVETSAAVFGIDKNLSYLAEHVEQISGTALDQFGRGWAAAVRPVSAPEPTADDGLLLVTPADLNESQELVLRSAMSRPLTVATGPPGTGKTQLVVNVVATAVAAGQSVLVASTNNRAVDEVTERCADLARGLVIRTGNKENLKKERQLHQRLLTEAQPRSGSVPTIAGELSAARRQLDAWRKDLAAQVERETRLRRACEARSAAAESLGLPADLLALAWQNRTGEIGRWADRARRRAKLQIFAGRSRSRNGERYARAIREAGGDPEPMQRRLAADATAFDTLVTFADAERTLRDGQADADVSDDDLERRGREVIDRVRAASLKLVRSHVAERVTRARPQLEARVDALATGKERQRTQRELMQELSAWVITTNSILQLGTKPPKFNLVVVDEASQCSIPAVLPLLFRAERALIIGDTKQLGHIARVPEAHERQARERAALTASWLEERRLSYTAHSAYDAASHVSSPPLLLDEHYRCHPSIASVVNDSCYNGRLEILTNVQRLRRARASVASKPWVLAWEDVDGTPQRGDNNKSWFNEAEIDRVSDVVRRLLADLCPDATIGVITPFRAQTARLEAAIHRSDRSRSTQQRVQVGTVHDFQGAACDAMVLSLVATSKAPEWTIHWVASQMNLWNVAVTRARSHLVTVGARSFWSQQPGVPAQLAKSSPLLPPDAWPAAAEPLNGVVAGDPLVDQLHDRLVEAGHADLERHALLDGYRCDFVLGPPGRTAAVLVDRGPREGDDAARHMRLMLARRRLLADVAGGDRSNGAVARGVRVPAWRILSGDGVPTPSPVSLATGGEASDAAGEPLRAKP
jgi:RecA/RadA recombinase